MKISKRKTRIMKTQIVPAPENEGPNRMQDNWVFCANSGGQAQPQTPLSSPSSEVQGVPSGPKLAAVVYTIEEAAVVLNVSTKTIRRLLNRGLLTCSKALRKKLIPRQQIENFLKATCDVPKTRF